MYTIQYAKPTYADKRSIHYKTGPAYLNAPDGVRYTFHGGYGDDMRRPTQQGCALIAAYMDKHFFNETSDTLTATLDKAKAWRGDTD